MKHAIVDSTGKIVNVIELEPGAQWSPPAGHSVVVANDPIASPGGRYDGSKFIAAPIDPSQVVTIPAPPVRTKDQALDALFLREGVTRADLKTWLARA